MKILADRYYWWRWFFFLVAQSKYSKYYAAQKNSSYFLEPTTRRGVPNAHVNPKPMVSRFCVASQNTVEPNRALACPDKAETVDSRLVGIRGS